MTSEPTANTASDAASTGTCPRRSAIRPMSGQHRDVAEQEAGDDRRGPLELVDRDADRRHHVGQREHHDIGVDRGERDGGGAEAEEQPGPPVECARSSRVIPEP